MIKIVTCLLTLLTMRPSKTFGAEPSFVVDLTDLRGTWRAELGYTSFRASTGQLYHIADNNLYTKFQAPSAMYVDYVMGNRAHITGYTLTSAYGNPRYDPTGWVFSGSTDGISWTFIHRQNNQHFSARLETKAFTTNNPNTFTHLRFEFINDQDNIWEIAELQIYGNGEGGKPIPHENLVLQYHKATVSSSKNFDRLYYSDSIAVYGIAAVDRTIPNYSTMVQVIDKAWVYTTVHYGLIGNDDGRLSIILDSDGGTTFAPTTSYEGNRITAVRLNPSRQNWFDLSTRDFWNMFVDMGFIVAKSAMGTFGSPATGLWLESYAHMYARDTLMAVGLGPYAFEQYRRQVTVAAYLQADPDRSALYGDIDWSRNWVEPIYNQYGGVEILTGVLEVQAQLYSKQDDGVKYKGVMNLGETVYVWGLAAKADLRVQADIAFSNHQEWHMQYSAVKLGYYSSTVLDQNSGDLVTVNAKPITQAVALGGITSSLDPLLSGTVSTSVPIQIYLK